MDQTLSPLTENTRRSIAAHDYEFALVAIVFYATNALVRGMELASLSRELAARLADVTPLKHVTAVNIARFIQQVLASLLGHGDSHEGSDDAQFDNPDDQVALANIYTLRAYFAVLFNDYQGASNVLIEARRYIGRLTGSPLNCVVHVCRRVDDACARGGADAIRTCREPLALLQRWERNGCQTAVPKVAIIEAEIAWARGQTTAALERYESAAHTARRLGLANDEAIAYELAARLCHKSSRTDFARLFMRNAYQAYLRWGALSKGNQLEREFQSYIGDHRSARPESGAWSVGDLVDLTVRDFASVSGTNESHEIGQRLLDTTTVLKAAQTISGEIVLDRVLIKLLRLALEHAGAQKATMLLSHDDRLYVEAIASVDGGSTRRLTPPIALEDCEEVPQSIIQFVARTRQALVLADATKEDVFTQDVYVKDFQPLSVMGLPIIARNEAIGVLYVEHRWLTGVFTAQRVEVLSLLASQAAISIENARLYADLQATRDEYRTLFDSANEGLFRISGEGVLIRANPTLARILGFDSTEALLADYRDLLDRVFLKKDRAQELMSLLDETGLADRIRSRRRDSRRPYVLDVVERARQPGSEPGRSDRRLGDRHQRARRTRRSGKTPADRRGGDAGEERVPRQHEPRDPHADERDRRLLAADARDAARSQTARIPRVDPQCRGIAADARQRRARLLEDRSRKARARRSAVQFRRYVARGGTVVPYGSSQEKSRFHGGRSHRREPGVSAGWRRSSATRCA